MILKELIEEKKITIAEFERKIGVKSPTISKIIERNSKISQDILYKCIIAYPELDPMWLLSGKGDMYKVKEYEIPDELMEIHIREEAERIRKIELKNKILTADNKDFRQTIRNLNDTIDMYRQRLEICEKSEVILSNLQEQYKINKK